MSTPHTQHAHRPRGLAMIAAAAGALALALAGMAPASATEPSSLPDPGVTTGSLTVTKYVDNNQAAGPAGSGQAQDITGFTVLPGVTFTVTPIVTTDPAATGGAAVPASYDLTTEGGWVSAQALDQVLGSNPEPSDFAATYSLGASAANPGPFTASLDTASALQQTTDASGQANFADLPLGLYYVQESATPNGVVPSLPFIVSLPMSTADGLGWNYSIYAYPKDYTLSASKSLNTTYANTTVGSNIEYTITSDLPLDTPSVYTVTDLLPAGLQCPTDGSVTTAAFTASTDTNAQTLAAGDYTVSCTTTAGTAGVASNQVEISLTATGLAKVVDAQGAGQQLAVNVVATVVRAPGAIQNTATVTVTVPTGTTTIPITTPDVISMGGATIWKYSDGESTATLGGAVFQLYPANAAGDGPDYTAGPISIPVMVMDPVTGISSPYNAGVGATSITLSDPNLAASGDPNAGATVTVPQMQTVNGTQVETFSLDAAGNVSVTNFITTGPTGVGGAGAWVYGIDTDPHESTATATSFGSTVVCGLQYGTYYLVEVQAPAGYELQTAPIKVTVQSMLDGWNGLEYSTEAEYSSRQSPTGPYADATPPNGAQVNDDLAVVDVTSNAGFTMPLTGWTMQQSLLYVGVVALVAAGVLVVVARRRQDKPQEVTVMQ